MKKVILTTLLSLFIAISSLWSQDNRAVIENSVNYLKEIQKEWKIPGMALAIVKDGKTIYSAGFGVREMGRDEVVDNQTLFQIGSISKSFTAAVMASLVAEGRVGWEDTVKNILPDFRLYDGWVEQNLQVKDIMTHHTGLQGQLGTYIPNMGYEREDIYRMLALLKPKYSFRGAYEYNNITFLIASKIIEKLTGKSWEENVRERIFIPLGMESSHLTGEEFAAVENAATPHQFYYTKGRELGENDWVDSIAVSPLHGENQALHWLTVIGPAGSISSTVEDMAKYTLFHLNNGMVNGKEIIPKKEMQYLHKGQTIVSQDTAKTTLYSHCWFVEQNNRYRLYFHTGTTWGFTAINAFVPELDLGFVVLVNSEAPALPRYALMRRIIELYKGLPDKDYNATYYKEWIEGERDKIKKSEAKVAEEKREAPAYKKVVGEYYKDELFGGAKIEEEGDDLYITIGPKGWRSKLSHNNGESFRFRMGGANYQVKFLFENEEQESCRALEIDFGYSENFGPWPKIR